MYRYELTSFVSGHLVVQLRLIFRVPTNTLIPGLETFNAYVQRFDIVPQINETVSGSATHRGPYPEPTSTMFVLKRARRADNSLMGDIIPLANVRALAALTPIFGDKADQHFSKETSLEYGSQFWLNKYIDKEFYYALTL